MGVILYYKESAEKQLCNIDDLEKLENFLTELSKS